METLDRTIMHRGPNIPPLKDTSGTWSYRAACKDTNPNVFFADDSSCRTRGRPNHREYYVEARAICATCPVKAECLDFAVTNHLDWGMYGGASPEERRAMRGRFRR